MKKQTCFGVLRVLVMVMILAMSTIGAWAQTERILHSFTGSSDGGSPQGGLILDGKGNLYGTAQQGGSGSGGIVFELTPNLNGTWTEKVLYNFTALSSTNDGGFPCGGLVFDGKGNLYGTTLQGGSSFAGTVFELSPEGNQTWSERILYSFTGGADGGAPSSGSLTVDSAGNLYGASNGGGAGGFGVVFEMVAGSDGTWSEKVLHTFTGGEDGAYPYGGQLILDKAGILYGSTTSGGLHDYGVVYKLTPNSDGSWREKVLYAFTNVDGVASPLGAMALDKDGNIYGTGFDVFELTPNSNWIFTEKPLHFFAGGTDGADPESGVIFDSAGNLYGTTNTGGAHRGSVYELSPGVNGQWTEKILHRFSATGGDGVFPYTGNLVIDGKGQVYGTTAGGGDSNYGVVYEITP
jgi:uncharacterized repeat protein (TIGR03803 family)